MPLDLVFCFNYWTLAGITVILHFLRPSNLCILHSLFFGFIFLFFHLPLPDSTWGWNAFPFSADIRTMGSTLSYCKERCCCPMCFDHTHICVSFFPSILSAESYLSRSNVVWVLHGGQNCVWELILCFK